MRCTACDEETEQAPCSSCGQEPRLDGRYTLVRVIGRGAHGTTWEALAPDGDRVALKEMVLGRNVAHKTTELWEREAAVLRQLEHPSIPTFVEAFTTGTGRMRCFCVVQEFVEGHTLAAELERHRYTEDEVLAIGEEIQAILGYLHGLSPPVVHRDLKPANVMRRPDGSLALIDFGSVRDSLKDDELGGSTVAGTFGYMAPEQFRGDAVPATDYYGLGALMAALLTRRDPARMLGQDRRLAWERHCTASPVMRQLVNGLLEAEPSARGRVELKEVGFAEPVEHELAALFEPEDPAMPVRHEHRSALLPGRDDRASMHVFGMVGGLVAMVCTALLVSVGLLVLALRFSYAPAPLPAVAPIPLASAPVFVMNESDAARTVSIGEHTQQVGAHAMLPVFAELPARVGVGLDDGVVQTDVPAGEDGALVTCDAASCDLGTVAWFGEGESQFRTRVQPEFPSSMDGYEASCRVDYWIEPSGRVAHVRPSACPVAFADAAAEAVSSWQHVPIDVPRRGFLRVSFRQRSD